MVYATAPSFCIGLSAEGVAGRVGDTNGYRPRHEAD